MISLLAAVPQETRLIRESLTNPVEESAHGLLVYKGKVAGHEICLAHSGVGKAAAAAAATALMIHSRPEALWLFGCGGAYPGSGLKVGDLALATSEIFGDEGVETAAGYEDLHDMGLAMRQQGEARFNSWPTSPELSAQAMALIPSLKPGVFVTLSTCTGTSARAAELERRTGALCENMEGAAVALACQQLSTPLLELRGISNMVEDRDTGRWDIPAGMAAAQAAVLRLLKGWGRE